MTVVNVITKAETQKLIDKFESDLIRIQTLLNTQFTEEEKSQVEEDEKICSEEYSHYLSLAQNGEGLSLSDKEFIDDIVNEISVECRNLNQIYQRQKVRERLQWIKQKFCQISPMDTCINYAANLEKEAEDLKKSLEADKCLKSLCQNLLDELEDYITRIQAAKDDIKFAIGMEAATGVFTIGISCVSVAVGIGGAMANNIGRAVVGGTTSAAGGAVGVVAETAGDAEIFGAAAGNIVRPAVKSMAAAIISSQGTKCALKSASIVSLVINSIAKIKEWDLPAKLKALFQRVKQRINKS